MKDIRDYKLMTGRRGRMAKAREAHLAGHYAHRGYHDKPRIPENSMAAFRRAVEHGFPSEFDVHLIADGSLVVFHDEDLMRETGASGQIEDYDIVNLSKLRLEGTDEKIPTFDEVLDLYEETSLPLLIELKTARGNYKELAERVCRRLDSYKGEFVIESFDPRALIEVKKIRPEFIRGQLVQNFIKQREGLPLYQAAMLSALALNGLVQPDFIACRYEDRNMPSVRRAAGDMAFWTIRSREDYEDAIREGASAIFEMFDPDQSDV